MIVHFVSREHVFALARLFPMERWVGVMLNHAHTAKQLQAMRQAALRREQNTGCWQCGGRLGRDSYRIGTKRFCSGGCFDAFKEDMAS